MAQAPTDLKQNPMVLTIKDDKQVPPLINQKLLGYTVSFLVGASASLLATSSVYYFFCENDRNGMSQVDQNHRDNIALAFHIFAATNVGAFAGIIYDLYVNNKPDTHYKK